MNGSISEKSFKELDSKHQMWIIYDTLSARDKETKEQRKMCAKEFVNIKKGKRIDKGIASGLGLIGGFIAGLFK